MRRYTHTLVGVALLMALATLPAFGQGATLNDLLDGKAAPLTLKLKELDNGWRCFTPGSANDAGTMLMSIVMTQATHQPTAALVYFTKGQLVTMNGETYLVAYSRLPEPPPDMNALRQGVAKPPTPATQNTEVSLCLLNLRTTGNLLNVRTFNLVQELAETHPQPEVLTDTAAQKATVNNLRQLAIAALMYAQDHNEQFPAGMDDAEKLQQTLQAAVKLDPQIYAQPNTGELYQANPSLSGKGLGQIANPAEMVLFFEISAWPDGKRGVSFVDGHVELVNEQRWAALKAKMTVR